VVWFSLLNVLGRNLFATNMMRFRRDLSFSSYLTSRLPKGGKSKEDTAHYPFTIFHLSNTALALSLTPPCPPHPTRHNSVSDAIPQRTVLARRCHKLRLRERRNSHPPVDISSSREGTALGALHRDFDTATSEIEGAAHRDDYAASSFVCIPPHRRPHGIEHTGRIMDRTSIAPRKGES
jgi:hypothetical protein